MISATADMIWPEVQNPHWKASQSMKARCTGWSWSPWASPSTVVTRLPWTVAASVRHDSTRRPSTWTVQAPHWPRSQPFLEPVSPSRSRSASSSVTRGSTVSLRRSPLTVVVMVTTFSPAAGSTAGAASAGAPPIVGARAIPADAAAARPMRSRRDTLAMPGT